jgi:hypothetical protein
MSFSGAVRVGSKAPFTFLSLLTLLGLIATASVASVNRLFTVSAAGKVSVARRTAKNSPGSVGNQRMSNEYDSSTLATNWQANAANSNPAKAGFSPFDGTDPVSVSLLPNVTGAVGSTVCVPITVSDLTGLGVLAYDLQVTFNPAILRPATSPYDQAGTVSSDMVITPNGNHSGHLIVSAFQANYLSGSGTLLNLVFVVVGLPGQSSGLLFENYTDPIPRFHAGFRFNAGSPQANTTNNLLTVNSPTAAAAKVSGLIVTSDGQPVSGATVIVIGGATAVRAITDGNGLYRVENLEAGGFYTVTPTRANYTFAPRERSFSLVGDRTDAVFTGLPDVMQSANPLDTTEYFVRQQYLDFLAREPDQGGLEYWSAQLDSCNGDAECLRQRRIGVSAAFFIEQEFQQTGSFIYGLYKGALGRRPQHAEYATDRGQMVGGADIEGKQQAFADSFVERAEFAAMYQASTTAASFVDALLGSVQQSSGVDLSSGRQSLISLYQAGTSQTNSRSLVLRKVTESAAVKEANYNAAFVMAEYFSYLRRDPDQGGYDFWLNVLNNSTPRNYRGMVCSFVTATEYQLRFGTVPSHSNAECGQ